MSDTLQPVPNANAPAPAADGVRPLVGMLPEEILAELTAAGEPAFRARQITEWVYQKRAVAWEDMSNLGKDLRSRLAQSFAVTTLKLATVQGSRDTTQKLLFRLQDGRYVESVLIPASPGQDGMRSDRRTVCVSSQVGCAYACQFCASGLAGFTRNLRPDEIVGQILEAGRLCGERIDNLVFMGMGEPLANLTNLLRALTVIQAEWGLGIGARHITVSTSGLAPQIRKLADFPVPIRLALSLHGATDEVRSRIMPVNKKYPIAELFDALDYWRARRKQRITFEYILIDGVNDSIEQAEALVKRARPLQAKINLIPYNKVDGLTWERPPVPVQEQFRDILNAGGVAATIRTEKGHDIDAACGQLRLRQETEEGILEG